MTFVHELLVLNASYMHTALICNGFLMSSWSFLQIQITTMRSKFISKCPKLSMPHILQDSFDQCPMLINADQNAGIDPYVNQYRSIPIPEAFWINASILIGIDWHWALIEGL